MTARVPGGGDSLAGKAPARRSAQVPSCANGTLPWIWNYWNLPLPWPILLHTSSFISSGGGWVTVPGGAGKICWPRNCVKGRRVSWAGRPSQENCGLLGRIGSGALGAGANTPAKASVTPLPGCTAGARMPDGVCSTAKPGAPGVSGFSRAGSLSVAQYN